MTEKNKDNIRIHLPLSFVETILHEFNCLTGLKAFDSKSDRVVASGTKKSKSRDSYGFDWEITDKKYTVPFEEVIDLDYTELIILLEEVTKGDDAQYELYKLKKENEQLKQALEKDIMRRCEIKEAFNERYGDVE